MPATSSALPPDEHREVVELIRLQVIAQTCRCGFEKSPQSAFCPDCFSRLAKAGVSYTSLTFHANRNPDLFDDWRLWSQYEAVADCADALRLGRWDGKWKRKQLEQS